MCAGIGNVRVDSIRDGYGRQVGVMTYNDGIGKGANRSTGCIVRQMREHGECGTRGIE
jgi:hypothetical protein